MEVRVWLVRLKQRYHKYVVCSTSTVQLLQGSEIPRLVSLNSDIWSVTVSKPWALNALESLVHSQHKWLLFSSTLYFAWLLVAGTWIYMSLVHGIYSALLKSDKLLGNSYNDYASKFLNENIIWLVDSVNSVIFTQISAGISGKTTKSEGCGCYWQFSVIHIPLQ